MFLYIINIPFYNRKAPSKINQKKLIKKHDLDRVLSLYYIYFTKLFVTTLYKIKASSPLLILVESSFELSKFNPLNNPSLFAIV